MKANFSALVSLAVLSLAFLTFITLANAGLSFKLPIPIFSFYNPNKPPHHLQPVQHAPPSPQPHHPRSPPPVKPIKPLRLKPKVKAPLRTQPHPHQQEQHLKVRLPPRPHHHHPEHSHQELSGAIYHHDPGSVVKFYYKESFSGQSNRVDIHNDGCREVPMDYWYQRPKSLWAKHCITLYQSGQCKGEGIQVAGMVAELRSAGMHYGVNSFKPCEKNIKIRFMPPGHHHHHSQQTFNYINTKYV